MDGFVRQFVDYRQYQIRSAPYQRPGLGIQVIGDDLLHVGGPSECTGFAGTHTGWIEMRVRVLDGPPDAISEDEWDAISETSLWCPDGVLTVRSMMGSTTEELAAVAVPQGLIRVRAHARDRIHETVRTDEDPPEQHELLVWRVTEETGPRTLLSDGTRSPTPQRHEDAAAWAVTELTHPPEPPEPDLPLVTVVRSRPPGTSFPEGRLPAGELEIHLTPAGDGVWTWRWAPASAPLPDDHATVVRVSADEIRHEGVPGRQAVLLGLIWDLLLTGPSLR